MRISDADEKNIFACTDRIRRLSAKATANFIGVVPLPDALRIKRIRIEANKILNACDDCEVRM